MGASTLRAILLIILVSLAVVIALVGLVEVANYPERLYTSGPIYGAGLVFLVLGCATIIVRWRRASGLGIELASMVLLGLGLFGLGGYGLVYDSADWMISIWPFAIGLLLLFVAAAIKL